MGCRRPQHLRLKVKFSFHRHLKLNIFTDTYTYIYKQIHTNNYTEGSNFNSRLENRSYFKQIVLSYQYNFIIQWVTLNLNNRQKFIAFLKKLQRKTLALTVLDDFATKIAQVQFGHSEIVWYFSQSIVLKHFSCISYSS